MGGEPDATSIASFDGTSHWVRWQWAPSEAALWDALSRADLSGLDWTTEGVFEVRERAYRLFDSAFSGADVEQSLTLAFEPGRYVIETASFEPSSEISVLLHRFRRL